MKHKPASLAAILLSILTSCGPVEQPATPSPSGGVQPQSNPSAPAHPYGQPLTAVNQQGAVVIMEGRRQVAVCKTACPNIEQTRFINEQNQIVIKSRANHGPATVQLFNTHTGRQEGSIPAYELSQGGPSWAAGMAD